MIETRGAFIECKACNYKFKFSSQEERNDWNKNKCSCPICHEFYCNKPPTERKLFYLQDKFFETNERRYFDKMVGIMLDYCESLIKKHYHTYIDSSETLTDKAVDAVSYFLHKYEKNPNFQIEDSFAGFLIHKIRQSLFAKENLSIFSATKRGKKDKVRELVSLNYTLPDGNIAEFEDEYSSIDKIEGDEHIREVAQYMYDLILSGEVLCQDRLQNYKRLLAFDLMLNHGDRQVDKFFQNIEDDEQFLDDKEKIYLYGRYGKDIYLDNLSILKQELKKDIRVETNYL